MKKADNMTNLCDCELSHNGLGMSGRECDCPAGVKQATPQTEGTSVDDDIKQAQQSDPAVIHTHPMEELRQSAVMIRTWIPEVFPANSAGQVHFVRAVMESVATVIDRVLADDMARRSTAAETERRETSRDDPDVDTEDNSGVFIARVAHEINRAYCAAIGDNSQPAWADAPDWQKNSAIAGVNMHMANPNATPEDSHKSWLAQKQAEGWTYGPVKDPAKKEHPCFLPYDELPQEQRVKDYLFRGVVHALRPV
jgi:RyR domain